MKMPPKIKTPPKNEGILSEGCTLPWHYGSDPPKTCKNHHFPYLSDLGEVLIWLALGQLRESGYQSVFGHLLLTKYRKLSGKIVE